MDLTLSVLLCTYNRHEFLRRALISLTSGIDEYPDEIIVVNGGDEGADKVVEEIRVHCAANLRLIKTANKNLAASRNIGLPHCTGDIVAMTDDDAEVFPDWVSQMKRAHQEHPEVGAVGGAVIGTGSDSPVGKVADLVTFPVWEHPRYVRTLPGVNVSYKRTLVEQIGLQDEMLFRGEDVDFNWRIKQLGYEVYFDPNIKVYHHHRPTWRGLLDQHYMYGRAYYLVRRKWPEMYSVYPHGVRSTRDVLKAINFAAALLYQPFLTARRLPSIQERLLALPFLFAIGASWKSGMVVQAWRERVSGAQGKAASR